MAKRRQKAQNVNRAEKNFDLGYKAACALPLPIATARIWRHQQNNRCPKTGWAVVTSAGDIHVHPTRLAEPAEWCWVLAHCVLHLCFDHVKSTGDTVADNRWNIACDLFVSRFLEDLGVEAPADFPGGALPSGDESSLVSRMEHKLPKEWLGWSTAGEFESDMVVVDQPRQSRFRSQIDWPAEFAAAISRSARTALDDAGGRDPSARQRQTAAEEAMSWFIASYPLLGAMAASFELVEDLVACQNLGIQIAAVWPERKEILLNPTVRLTSQELLFVIAHELLHVGLRHDVRTQGRDHFLWNVACDYVINGWLTEMEVGHMPAGSLYDQTLTGQSAEEIYDRIVEDLASRRRAERLATFAGRGQGDIINERSAAWWRGQDGVTLDDFYRDALQRGLELHTSRGRGFLPGGLIEEIRALKQPPIPWDVKLADWFDEHFQPLEKRRTYARANRRQSATPDIPRPAWHVPEEAHKGRTFAVVLDTSGSMDPIVLGKGLGAIASYATVRDVAAIRLVFCDAGYHDVGYVTPTALGDRVKVVGRGGTVLQPAITFLEQAKDFPKTGPILVITDGACDVLSFAGSRPHGFLLSGGRLPFKPKGDVFLMS